MLPVVCVASEHCIHVYDRQQETCPTPKMTSTPLYPPTKNVNPSQLQPYHVKMFHTLLLQFFKNLRGPPVLEEGKTAMIYIFSCF